MDAFNTQPGDNLGSVLPTSQNVPLKEDLDFLPKATPKSSVKLLRRLAILAVIVSTFTLVTNEISFYHFSSFYNFTCTFISLASLIISSALIFWSTKTLKQEEGNTDAASTRSWELFNQGLYTTLLFRAAISIPLIANMLFQGDNTAHHLRAVGATYEDETFASTENALRSIALVLPFFEVLLSLIFVQAARTIFPHIREQTTTMTRMVFIGSATLMASSFGMLYALRYASDYQDLHDQPFPSWNIGGLVFLGVVSIITSGLVWTVNHTKWRGPYIIVAGVLAASTLGLALFSTLSYNNSQNIASLYGDTKNLHIWAEQMAATHKEDLRTVGCPSKYLPKSIANDPSFDALWGPGTTTKDGLPAKYLNLACIDLLGNQQASYFAEATVYGLLAAVSGLIILIGFLYFNHTQWRDAGERNKKDFRWLAVLGAIVLAFNVAMIMYQTPFPPASIIKKLSETTESRMVLATNINNVYNQTIQELVTGKSRFVVFKHDTKDPLRVNLIVGNKDSIFSDFSQTFDDGKEQVGIMYVGQGASQQPYLVILAPAYRTASYVLDGFGLPTNTSDYERLGLKRLNYYVARQKKEIQLTTVVMNGKAGGKISLYQFEEGQWEAPEAEEYGGRLDEPSIFATTDDTSAPTRTPYTEIFKALTNKKYRFAVLSADPNNPMSVKTAVAPYSWTFNDFVANFSPDQDQVGFINLGSNEGAKPYMIVFNPSTLTRSKWILNRFSVPTSTEDLQKAGLPGASYYVVSKLEDLILENIINNSKAGSVGILFDTEEESDAPEDQQDQYDQQAQSDQEQSDQEQSDQEKSDQEQYYEGYGVDNLPATGVDSSPAIGVDASPAITTIDDSTSTADVPAFQEIQNNPYAGIFNGLNNRKYRFIVLKHDPNDPMAVKISGGAWTMNFQDFLNTIDANREQVAFVYIGPTYSEKLYRVVIAPSILNSNAGNVVDSFQLPRDSKGLAQLGLKGVSTYVAGSKSELTEQRIITYGKSSV